MESTLSEIEYGHVLQEQNLHSLGTQSSQILEKYEANLLA